MVKIRMTKLGRHKLPAYRIVAIDSRKRRDGLYLALLGTYEPSTGKAKIDEAKVLDLLSKGAQLSDTCLALMKKQGIYAKFVATKKIKVVKHARKSAKKVAAKKAAKAAPKKAAAAAKPAEAPKAEVKEAK